MCGKNVKINESVATFNKRRISQNLKTGAM